jgi:hypothetical protein
VSVSAFAASAAGHRASDRGQDRAHRPDVTAPDAVPRRGVSRATFA